MIRIRILVHSLKRTGLIVWLREHLQLSKQSRKATIAARFRLISTNVKYGHARLDVPESYRSALLQIAMTQKEVFNHPRQHAAHNSVLD